MAFAEYIEGIPITISEKSAFVALSIAILVLSVFLIEFAIDETQVAILIEDAWKGYWDENAEDIN